MVLLTNPVETSRLKKTIRHAFVVALSALGLSSVAFAGAAAGRAVTVIGTVNVRHGGAAGGEVLRPAMTISEGDVIETAANGKAKLLMNDKTILDINSSSTFRVDEYKGSGGERQVGLAVDNGKVRTAVSEPLTGKGKFIIKTKTTTMGVRGTEFIVASQLTQLNGGGASQKLAQVNTEITVVQGRVEVTDFSVPGGRPIELTAGKQLVTTAQVDLNSGQVARLPASGGGGGNKGSSEKSGSDGKQKSGGDKASGEKSGGEKASNGASDGSGDKPSSAKSSAAEGKSESSGGDGGSQGGPVVRDVPPKKMDEIRNDSKIGDLSLKNILNIEDKSQPREAPPAATAQKQPTSGERAAGKAPGQDQAKLAGAPKEDSAGKGVAGSARSPASTMAPPPNAPSFNALGNLGLDVTAAINTAISSINTQNPNGGAYDVGRAAAITSGTTATAATIPINVYRPVGGNVNVTVRFNPAGN